MATHYVLTAKQALTILTHHGLVSSFHRSTCWKFGYKFTDWHVVSGDISIATRTHGKFSYMRVRATCPAVAKAAATYLAQGLGKKSAKPKLDPDDNSGFSFQISTFRAEGWYLQKNGDVQKGGDID